MKVIILTILVMLLSSCAATPTIKQTNNNELHISYKDKLLIAGKGARLYKRTIYLPNINIYQSIYKIDKQYITYEHVNISNGYKFTKEIKRSVSIIFDTDAYDLQYRKGNLYFFTLHQSKRETIYLIVENINSSALKLLYGFNKANYETIKKAVQQNRAAQNNKKQINQIIKDKKDFPSYIKTQWSPKVLIIDQLISKPVGRASIGRR